MAAAAPPVPTGKALVAPTWNGCGIELVDQSQAPLIQCNQLYLGGPALKLVDFYPLVEDLGCKANLACVHDALKMHHLRNKTAQLLNKVFLVDTTVNMLAREYQQTPAIANNDWCIWDTTQYGVDLLSVNGCIRLMDQKIKSAYRHDNTLHKDGKPLVGDRTAIMFAKLLLSPLTAHDCPATIMFNVTLGQPVSRNKMEELKKHRPPLFFIGDLQSTSSSGRKYLIFL